MKRIIGFFLILPFLLVLSASANGAPKSIFDEDMLMLDRELHFLTFSFLDTAPLFIAHRFDGSVFRLNEHSGRLSQNPKLQRFVDIHGVDPRKHIILSFYASYCVHCKDEVSEVLRFYKNMSATREDILLVFIGMDSEKEDARSFFSDNNITLPEGVEVLFNPIRNTFAPGKLYNVERLPALFVISKEGEIIYDRTGYKTGHLLEEVLRNVITYYEQLVTNVND